jgi:glycogen debranching enzyme
MAEKLGLQTEALEWEAQAEHRAQLVNNTMWDDETGFYYQVDKVDHDFTYENPNDLKRQELIGFLPLWAGIADKNQAKQLVEHMTNPDKFWQEYGIPSLAADDPYYDPEGYWNGPVWVEWQYLFLRGLLDYNYHDVAAELVDKVAANMISQLKEDHTFWEFYSPDEQWGGHHQTYIWAGLIAKMLHEVRIK